MMKSCNYKFNLYLLLVVGIVTGLTVSSVSAADSARFFHSGNGTIRLAGEKTGKHFNGRYRQMDGQYRVDALKDIAGVFGAPYDPSRPMLSLRLIEFLDFLEDRLKPGTRITIISGYRAPEYNANLRKRGALAAKASLHQYGMAADIVMDGVPSKKVWETVRALGFGGAGYYHDRTVHVDVGPTRFWDEKTTGVGTGLSDDNKLIGVVADYDVYAPGDMVRLRFIRMTAFPIGVRSVFWLLAAGQPDDAEGGLALRMRLPPPVGMDCGQFSDIHQMAAFDGYLPPDLPPGRYRIKSNFCDPFWEKMPKSVLTPEFEIRRP